MLAKLLPYYRKLVPQRVREPLSRALNWPEGGQVSYSAHGEDLFVRAWLDKLGVERTSIRYLDIGGNHPSILSNTFLFYKMGGSGVVVEPTPHEAGLLASKRPRDTLVRAGIAFDARRSAQLHLFSPSVYNTFDPDEAERTYEQISGLGLKISREGTIDVPLVPAMDIVKEHFGQSECHFLSVDVEGVDSMILKSLDFHSFRPWIICCERPDGEITDQLKMAGYVLVCEVPDNAIFMLQPNSAQSAA